MPNTLCKKFYMHIYKNKNTTPSSINYILSTTSY